MKLMPKFFYFLSLTVLIAACSSSESIDKDLEKPTITINYEEGFPKACIDLVGGETYNFKAKVTDNKALAAYSLEIHHNFDHHTHDDQEETCNMDEQKTAINPLIYLESYEIEDGIVSYEIDVSVLIPIDADKGDYHCTFSITDVTGWQSRTSVGFKIID